MPATLFEFGPFVLDPARRRLLRDGVPQILTPKAFDVLLLLVEQRERVVSKDEIFSTLWPGTFVEEANLTQQIFLLRKLLNGDSATPEFVATIPRRGYRFVGEVVERLEAPAPVAAPVHSPFRRSPRRLIPWLIGAGLGAGALVVAIQYQRPDPVEPRLISVTALPGLERFPSISPDGNFVAFSWTGPDPLGSPDIWIKAVEGAALRRLTETPEGEGAPAWSPDGRQIAFPRAGRGVFVASALGGDERKVADSGSQVGWTRDGGSLLVRDLAARPSSFGIYRVDLETGRRNQVTSAPDGIGDWTFDVSPDGRTLAFVRFDRPGVSDVHVVPTTGGEPVRRTDWNTNVSRVAWTPDGRDLIYAVADPHGLGQSLFRIPAFGSRVERGVRLVHPSGMFPSISHPGSGRAARLAFHTTREDVGLRLFDLHAPVDHGVLGSLGAVCDSSRIDYPGPFSRDGQRIAFVSDRSGSPQVWVAHRDGSGLRQLTTFKAVQVIAGGWSPDERRLVVDASIDGNSDIYVVDAVDGRVTRLTTEPSLETHPSWSHDGQWVYFNSTRSGSAQVWKVSPHGGSAIRVTQHGGVEPKEAADGRTLYYVDRPPPGAGGMSGPATLRQVSVDGGDEIPVLERVRFGLWSLTDEGIVFLTVEKDADAIDYYVFSDRRVRRLGALPDRVSRIGGYGQLRVSRDGRWALISVTDHWESDIVVADGID